MDNIFKNSFHTYKYWHKNNTSFDTKYGYRFHNFRSVEEGKLIAICNNKTITVNKGELLYIPPEHYAEIKIFADPNCHGTVIRLCYFPDVDELDYPPQAIKMNGEIEVLLNILPSLTNTSNITSNIIWKAYKVLYLLQQNMTKYDDKRIPKLEKALIFMRENDTYTVPELARYCEMSERAFYAAFKEILGITPVKMKQKIQGLKAEFLLKTSDLSIEEITNMVGFSSPNHLRTIFKEVYNALPKDVRKF